MERLFCVILVLVQVFAGHVIFGYFPGANFLYTTGIGVLNARDDAGLERVPFFEQLVNAFRICAFDIRQTLQVSRLLAQAGPGFLAGVCR